MFWTEENLNSKDYNKLVLIKKSLPPFSSVGFAIKQRDFVGRRKMERNRLAEERVC